jgi:hypothetical protein
VGFAWWILRYTAQYVTIEDTTGTIRFHNPAWKGPTRHDREGTARTHGRHHYPGHDLDVRIADGREGLKRVDGGHPRKRIASDQCEVPKSHGSEGKRNDRQNIRTLLLPITDYGLFVGIVNTFTACAST